jgi:hypothetical protein
LRRLAESAVNNALGEVRPVVHRYSSVFQSIPSRPCNFGR